MEEIIGWIVLVAGLIGYGIWYEKRTPEQKARMKAQKHGKLVPELICPHCQAKGKVRVQSHKRKTGYSAAKTVSKGTAAMLTGGASLLGTGVNISRYAKGTRMHCGNCTTSWVVE